MTREELKISAATLQQLDDKSATEYASKRDNLVNLINKKMMSRLDIVDMVGEQNIEMMKDNHANHARFMESVFIKFSHEVLVDTVLWVFRAYRSRNFSSTYWAAQLNTWIEIYKEELSPECFKAIYPYYNWMQINIPTFNKLAEEDFEVSNSSH